MGAAKRGTLGAVAGLLAALVLSITPVVVATDRNNTIDSTLILALLLAAWAFIKATELGRWRYQRPYVGSGGDNSEMGLMICRRGPSWGLRRCARWHGPGRCCAAVDVATEQESELAIRLCSPTCRRTRRQTNT
jgi:hypothetical protein